MRSPRAGGAELLTHELAKGLVERECDVTLFTSRPQGLPREEELDGVRVVRRGSELTTRLFAPGFVRGERPDVVVEEINTLPYFSPLWARARTVLLIAQLAREVWWHEAPLPLAAVGYASEPLYLLAYRDTETVTISDSTLSDLRGVGLRAPVHVIPMASSAAALPSLPPKTPVGRAIIVGRLVPSKRVGHALAALARLRRTLPEASLVVVGDGPERDALVARARALGIADAVTFAGRVPEGDKSRLLAEADVLVACAAREGWGLTVTEAARLGTPSVCYRVPGLRDSVVDGRTGLLTDESPEALAAAVLRLVEAPEAYEVMRRRAWEHNRELSWARTAGAFAQILAH